MEEEKTTAGTLAATFWKSVSDAEKCGRKKRELDGIESRELIGGEEWSVEKRVFLEETKSGYSAEFIHRFTIHKHTRGCGGGHSSTNQMIGGVFWSMSPLKCTGEWEGC